MDDRIKVWWCMKYKHWAAIPCEGCYERLRDYLGCVFRLNGEEDWQDNSDHEDSKRIRTKD